MQNQSYPAFVFLVVLLLLVLRDGNAAETQPEAIFQSPNVVLIFADDLGYGDVGVYGAKAVQTPNIDRLANEGMRFTDAHAAASTCTPSRYGLLTGRYPFRSARAVMPVDPLEPLVLDTKQFTLGKLFQQAGYATGCVGKWHLGLGENQPDWNGLLKPGPLEVGFDTCFCVPFTNDRVPCVYVKDHRVVGLDSTDPIQITHYSDRARRFSQLAGQRRIGHMKGGKAALWEDERIGEVLTEQAVAFIEQNQDHPFFLYFPTISIHVPHTPHSRFHGTSQCGVYGDFIHELDWSVGRVLETLDRLELSHNTLVIFTSDNGAVGSNLRDKHRTNGDLRGYKFGIYEGGHRVPFIARWPSHIRSGSQCDQLIGLTDMLATSAALLGRELPETAGPDSVDFLPLLVSGQESPATRSTWLVHAGKRRQMSFREGGWKLVFPNPWTNLPANVQKLPMEFSDELVSRCELYNLDEDLREEQDLAKKHPELVSQLLAAAMRQMAGDYERDEAPMKKEASPKKTAAMEKAAPKKKPPRPKAAEQQVHFNFESDALHPWHVVMGQPPEVIRAYPENLIDDQNKRFLSTRATGPLGPGDLSITSQGNRAVIESPVFTIVGDEATFRLGGNSTKPGSIFLALCTIDGQVLRQTTPPEKPQPQGKLKEMAWDISDLKGEQCYLRVIDQGGHRHDGHLELDDFRIDGSINRAMTSQRRDQHAADRRTSLQALRGELAKSPEVVFAVRESGKNGHWYANFGHWSTRPDYKMYGVGGQLCVLNTDTGDLRRVIDDPEGAVRDPQVHYDAKKILFSYRPGGTEYYHLYEIDTDGSNLRQLTFGPYDDIEPSYLPHDRIVFCSSRCKRWVPCHWVEVATLHTCDADGSNLRAISSNVEHENTPWPLADGRILYTRWEYTDRSVLKFHHLWTANPDGTSQMVYFGNMHPGGLFIDAKPISESDSVVFVNSPQHGRVEHAGTICTVDPLGGPDAKDRIHEVSCTDNFRDPYPLGKAGFLVAQNERLVLLSNEGHTETCFELPEELSERRIMCHEPRPLVARPREALIADRTDPNMTTGRLMVEDVYHSRKLTGIERGEIKKLLVLEALPKSLNASYGPEPISVTGAHNLERILGTVPVEEDGSAYFEVPAMRSLFFVALDEDDRAVKRMHSFVTLQPGEAIGCVGCHEHRTDAPRDGYSRLGAMQKPPQAIDPIPGIPQVIDFPRDVQAVLDRHCVACHDYEHTPAGGPRAGGVVLCGDRGPVYTHAYAGLHSTGTIKASGSGLGNTDSYAVGSGASPLLTLLDESHHNVKLEKHERDLLRLWVDVGAPFAGTNAAEASGMFRRFPQRLIDNDQKTEYGPRLDVPLPSAAAVFQRCCNKCHSDARALAVDVADTQGGREWNLGPGGKRRKYTSHLIYNLSRPELSTVLLAPLAAEAGGYGICGASKNSAVMEPVFASKDDPDYQALLSIVNGSKEILDRMTRFDMPGFVPSEHYIREMKRYGFLEADWKPGDPIDVYSLDQAYWESFWIRPSE